MSTIKAQPAEPTLAHSLLLEPSSRPSGVTTESVFASSDQNLDRESSNAWDLKVDIENGLHSTESDVFRSGTVIGFSRLRGKSPEDNEDEFVGELPRHLLTKWLLRSTPTTSPTQAPTPKAYIIHPPHITIFSPTKLLSSLQSHSPSLNRQEAITLLDSVQLFPVFDFSSAADAIAEVSERLHALHRSEGQDQKHEQAVIVLAGLDTLTESVIRSSNAVRGTAVLTSALRTLTQLSRMHSARLSIVLVNTSGVGPFQFAQSQAQAQAETQVQSQSQSRGDGPHSIFTGTDTPLFPSLLMRTLDLGVDTHLLMSRTNMSMGQGSRAATVVEVIKVRVGAGLGRWTVWP
ncbi:hypothetical protein BDV18DRAFT_156700 [Aspergillus unguis]